MRSFLDNYGWLLGAWAALLFCLGTWAAIIYIVLEAVEHFTK